MTEQEINNLIDSKIGKVKISQLPEATQTSGLYSIGYTGNQSVKYKANLLQGDPLTVRKTYQTEAEALSDKNPIDTTTSLPLTVGQFVSIVDDGDKNGIYRIGSIGGDGTMVLELQGKLGDMSEYAKTEETLDKLIKGWVISEAMAISNPTYSADGNISGAVITWGDGDVGSISNVVVSSNGITSIRYNRSNGDYATMSVVYDNKGDFQSQEVIITKI